MAWTMDNMWCNQAEWVGSWQEHVTGFRSFNSFKYMYSVNVKPDTCHKHVIDDTKINEHVNPTYSRGSQVSGFKFYWLMFLA